MNSRMKYSSLIAAASQRLLRDASPSLRVFAYDARGHGATQCEDSTTLSAEFLTEDGIAIVQYLWDRLMGEIQPRSQQEGDEHQSQTTQTAHAEGTQNAHQEADALPSVILVGHRYGLRHYPLCGRAGTFGICEDML